MRYMPIVRILRSHDCTSDVTEIGSGSSGMAPYLNRPITGVDAAFQEPPHPLLRQLTASVLNLPFPSRSRQCVVSTDMLEHLPPDSRQYAVAELARVTRKLLVLGVPTGPGAEAQDRAIHRLYAREQGVPFPFLAEHLEFGLPSTDDLRKLVADCVLASGRTAAVHYSGNSNLRVRLWIMRLWVKTERPIARWTWIALNHLHPILSRMNFGRCYRTLAIIVFDDDSEAVIGSPCLTTPQPPVAARRTCHPTALYPRSARRSRP